MRRRLIRLALLALAVLAVFGAWVAVGLPARSEVRALAAKDPARTRLMAQREEEAKAKGRKPRTVQRYVPLSAVSRHLIHAVLSSEDQKFFGHEGVDWNAIQESLGKDVQERRFVRGGSTITQQLAKNLYFGTARNPVRKLRELVVTQWLEADLPKARILALYLNVIEWGYGVYGCEAAARHWYGKPASALSEAEAAGLAAMIPNPRRINPRVSPERHQRATRRVLWLMALAGYIGRDVAGLGAEPPAEAAEAADEDAGRTPTRRPSRKRPRPRRPRPLPERAFEPSRRPCDDRPHAAAGSLAPWGALLTTAAAREDADVVTSSDEYARRFSGSVGSYFLEVQSRVTLELLADLPGASVLDVGGGHGQTAGALVAAGHPVTILGSDPSCESRVRRWTRAGQAAFVATDLLDPGLPDRSFDVVLSYRLLPHARRFEDLVATLARLARTAVIVDYPTRRSLNAAADAFFGLKKNVERDTRPFRVFADGEVLRAFAAHGFRPTARRGQFFFPMALHRAIGWAGLARGLEAATSATGLTRLLGSPVILRLERD